MKENAAEEQLTTPRPGKLWAKKCMISSIIASIIIGTLIGIIIWQQLSKQKGMRIVFKSMTNSIQF